MRLRVSPREERAIRGQTACRKRAFYASSVSRTGCRAISLHRIHRAAPRGRGSKGVAPAHARQSGGGQSPGVPGSRARAALAASGVDGLSTDLPSFFPAIAEGAARETPWLRSSGDPPWRAWVYCSFSSWSACQSMSFSSRMCRPETDEMKTAGRSGSWLRISSIICSSSMSHLVIASSRFLSVSSGL